MCYFCQMEAINDILHELQSMTQGIPKDEKLPESVKKQIYDYLKGLDLNPIILKTISKWLIFQGNRKSSLEEMFKVDWFNRVRKTDVGTKRRPVFVFKRRY